MTCPKCGHDTQEGAAYCSQCGASLQSDAGESAPSGRKRSLSGRVLAFDWKASSGVISGADGFRYSFSSQDWGSESPPRIGASINFLAEGDQAREIYPVAGWAGGAVESKRLAAGVLAILLGLFGIHKFYLGYNQEGVIMLLAGTIGWILVLPGLVVLAIAIVEGIIYLTKTDEEFEQTYISGRRPWF